MREREPYGAGRANAIMKAIWIKVDAGTNAEKDISRSDVTVEYCAISDTTVVEAFSKIVYWGELAAEKGERFTAFRSSITKAHYDVAPTSSGAWRRADAHPVV